MSCISWLLGGEHCVMEELKKNTVTNFMITVAKHEFILMGTINLDFRLFKSYNTSRFLVTPGKYDTIFKKSIEKNT